VGQTEELRRNRKIDKGRNRWINDGSHSGTNRGRDRRNDIGRDKGLIIAISLDQLGSLPYHRIAEGKKIHVSSGKEKRLYHLPQSQYNRTEKLGLIGNLLTFLIWRESYMY
jgi:hypothetical protein